MGCHPPEMQQPGRVWQARHSHKGNSMELLSIALALGGWTCLFIAARAAMQDLATALDARATDAFDASVARWGYVGEGRL